MIKVIVEKDMAKFRKVKILGHALYDDYGKDIVCSAASSIVTTTINGILLINKDSLSYMVSNKGMCISIKSDDTTTQLLIKNMINLLKELEKNYKDNIKFM